MSRDERETLALKASLTSLLFFLSWMNCGASTAKNITNSHVDVSDKTEMKNISFVDVVTNWTKVNRPVQFKEIVPWNYDKLKPPKDKNGVAVVRIKLSVLAMRSVNEREMTYEMDVFLHLYWQDPRVQMPTRYPDSRLVMDNRWREALWMPDIFFKNARDGKLHNIIIPYTYFVLHNDSEIFLASRLTMKLNCMMDLTMYPHDEQECDVIIMSLTHTKDTLILKWKDFQITRNILLAQFKVPSHSFSSCDQVYDIGAFSCLVGKVRLSRRLGFFLINKFVPSFLIVLVSFVTFWIPPTAYPARVSLTVTSVLTSVTQQIAASTSAPDVSYVTALNVWMMGCIAFVFSTLLEYTFIVAMINTTRQMEKQRSIKEFNGSVTSRPPSSTHKKEPGYTMDRVSRVLFPAFLGVFVFVYWCVFGKSSTD